MKIAACYEKDTGNVFQHFGHTENFKIYEIDLAKKEILSSEIVDNGGTGHEALAVLLKNLGVSALVCGGIGSGAVAALKAENIVIYGGNKGRADDFALMIAKGNLSPNEEANCKHHHEHEHNESSASTEIKFTKL